MLGRVPTLLRAVVVDALKIEAQPRKFVESRRQALRILGASKDRHAACVVALGAQNAKTDTNHRTQGAKHRGCEDEPDGRGHARVVGRRFGEKPEGQKGQRHGQPGNQGVPDLAHDGFHPVWAIEATHLGRKSEDEQTEDGESHGLLAPWLVVKPASQNLRRENDRGVCQALQRAYPSFVST